MNFQTIKTEFLNPLAISFGASLISVCFTLIAIFAAIDDQQLIFSALPVALAIAFVLPIIIGFPLVKYFRAQQQKIEHINSELNRLLRFDTMTNVLTRAAFFKESAKKASTGNTNNSHAALFLDIDHFKNLNDTFGHSLGDKVLKIAGQVLNDTLSENDLVGRLGGEEFAIYLNDVSESKVKLIAGNILSAYETAAQCVDGHATNSTISIGAVVSRQVKNIDALLAHADQLLYQAKANGRNKSIFKNIDIDTVASNTIVESIIRKPRKGGTSSHTPNTNVA